MKEFNLDAALNGEPVYANGQKCYVVREVTELLDDQSLRRFAVIFPNSSTNAEVWDEHDLIDDIRMWEDPKISVEDLPKPFYPNDGDAYYYIFCGKIYHVNCYSDSNPIDENAAKNGQYFRAKEDAQKWLDFMKSMME